MTVYCYFCGEPLNPQSPTIWHRVQGWDRKGAAGGSDIALRERIPGGPFACNVCIGRQKAGINPGQTSLTPG